MRSAKSRNGQWGSASLLLAMVVLPFMLLLIALAVEISQFFGAREEVLEHLDHEVSNFLRGQESEEHVASRIRRRLAALRPYVVVDDVRVTRNGAVSEGLAHLSYRGPLIEMFTQLSGISSGGTPMEVVARARRPRSGALLILDRTIGEGADGCADPDLIARAEAVGALMERLRGAAVEVIRVGVYPGVDGEVAFLSDDDGIPRCPGTDPTFVSVRRVQGVPGTAAPEPLSAAFRIVEGAVSLSNLHLLERNSVIIVASHTESNEELMRASFSLLEQEEARRRSKLRAVGVAISDVKDGDFFAVRSLTERTSYLRVSGEDLRSVSFETALLHHVQGRSVISR